MHEIFDANKALAHLGGNEKRLAGEVMLFLADSSWLLSQIKTAASWDDCPGLERIARSLQAPAFGLGAQGVYWAALKLKRIGRDCDLTSVEPACEAFVNELERLKTALGVFLQEKSPELSSSHSLSQSESASAEGA